MISSKGELSDKKNIDKANKLMLSKTNLNKQLMKFEEKVGDNKMEKLEMTIGPNAKLTSFL